MQTNTVYNTGPSATGRQVSSIARSGFGGVCAVYSLFFGIFLCFSSIGLLVTGSFAENNGMRVAGIILVVLGVVLIFCSICACIYVSKQIKTHQQGVVLNQPVITGMTPPNAAYPPSGTVVNYPQGTQPPPQAYPPQGYPPQPGYPPQAGYPAAPNPNQPMAPYPTAGYQSTEPTAPPSYDEAAKQ